MIRVMFLAVCSLLPTTISAEFYSMDTDGDVDRKLAIEAAQCSGFTEFMTQLAEKASKPEQVENFWLQTAALQTYAALTFVNRLDYSEDNAKSMIYEITGISANKIAQDMLKDFANTHEIWSKQCDPYLLRARELAESTGWLRSSQPAE